MLAALTDPETWTALFKIAVINVVLSGDNALVIALACRSLPPRDQKRAFIVGTAGIVVLMTALTSFAALLMTLPYIQIVGSLLLLWIGVKLLLPENEDGDVKESNSFMEAVKTIIIADIVMSLDNVLGMAGAAGRNLLVGGIRRRAAGVAGDGGDDAGQTLEGALLAPEAASGEHGHLVRGRKRRHRDEGGEQNERDSQGHSGIQEWTSLRRNLSGSPLIPAPAGWFRMKYDAGRSADSVAESLGL